MGQGRPGTKSPILLGRRVESEALERVLAEALAGRSRVLVLRGEPGIGKSALLRRLSERLGGWRVAEAVGVESEMELAYAGLHQICAPMLDGLERLPHPQRRALSTVFGLSAGAPPDRFLVALATLTLLADAAERQPLALIVDDAHWLDRASEQILAFVARRLLAERIAIVCAATSGVGDDVLAGLPELEIAGLGESDARALLLGRVRGPLDAAVCERIIAESHGNPLALVELPHTASAADLAGGFGLPAGDPVGGKIEQSYGRRLDGLPPDARLLVLAAAAEPLGDPTLLHRAAERLGIDIAAIGPAMDAGLVTVNARVEFAHPLVRSTAYRQAAAEDRERVHRALADVTDADADPDRKAWHRAHATSGPDEEVAAELERSAARAQGRGGVAAAAAFLERAVELTAEPAERARRALAAAPTSLSAGALDAAAELLRTAEAGRLGELERARIELLRSHLAFASGLAGEEPSRLLLNAARRFEPHDLELARETYLAAWRAAVIAAQRDVVIDICRAARALPAPDGRPRPADLMLDGVARRTIEGCAAGAPLLRLAVKALAELPAADLLQWSWLGAFASAMLWDIDGMLDDTYAQLIRDAGALAELPIHLAALGISTAWAGDFAGAAALIAEADGVAAATGSRVRVYASMKLSALQGKEMETVSLRAAAMEAAASGGNALAPIHADWAAAVLYNGLARYGQAAQAAGRAASDILADGERPSRALPEAPRWALPELVEAAARTGDVGLARAAFERLEEATTPSGSDFALGIESRCRALVSANGEADDLYRKAIDHLSRTPLRPELARAHLLYGEWLRRDGRRGDARAELRTAHDAFVGIGMTAFAERTRRELVATGERVHKRRPDSRDELTPQEEQIARLARNGLSNREIGGQLFLSPRTIEWHLRHVFMKLEITSRSQLRDVIPAEGRSA